MRNSVGNSTMVLRLPVLSPFQLLFVALLYSARFLTRCPSAVRRIVRTLVDVPIRRTVRTVAFACFFVLCALARCIIVEFPEQKAPLQFLDSFLLL